MDIFTASGEHLRVLHLSQLQNLYVGHILTTHLPSLAPRAQDKHHQKAPFHVLSAGQKLASSFWLTWAVMGHHLGRQIQKGSCDSS